MIRIVCAVSIFIVEEMHLISVFNPTTIYGEFGQCPLISGTILFWTTSGFCCGILHIPPQQINPMTRYQDVLCIVVEPDHWESHERLTPFTDTDNHTGPRATTLDATRKSERRNWTTLNPRHPPSTNKADPVLDFIRVSPSTA
jgi:hypothetical protein